MRQEIIGCALQHPYLAVRDIVFCCIPLGALSNKYNPENSNPSSLCAICSNQKTCPRNASERYYGYHGAYRCLTEGAGDVAFVRHLTVFDFTGRDNDLNPGRDFKLLCPDGTRAGNFKRNGRVRYRTAWFFVGSLDMNNPVSPSLPLLSGRRCSLMISALGSGSSERFGSSSLLCPSCPSHHPGGINECH